jgi:hypothetical protein
LKFINPDNNKAVLLFGTTFYDNYYPLALISFMPEHFSAHSKNN